MEELKFVISVDNSGNIYFSVHVRDSHPMAEILKNLQGSVLEWGGGGCSSTPNSGYTNYVIKVGKRIINANV